MYALPNIQSGWNALLKPFRIRVEISGVFAHGTPWVKPIAPKGLGGGSCELADLCVFATRSDIAPNGSPVGNSLLLQAKLDLIEAKLSDLQKELYEFARIFEYTRPNRLAKQTGHSAQRCLPLKSEPALAYWDLGDATDPHYHYPGHFYPSFETGVFAPARWPEDGWPDNDSFGTALVEVLLGEIGHDFYSSISTSNQDWSRIMQDLIAVTATSLTNKKNIGVSKLPRGIGPIVLRYFHKRPPVDTAFLLSGNSNALEFALQSLGHPLTAASEAWTSVYSEEALRDEIVRSGYVARDSFDCEDPPRLGSEWPAEPPDDGGGGSQIFIHLSRLQ